MLEKPYSWFYHTQVGGESGMWKYKDMKYGENSLPNSHMGSAELRWHEFAEDLIHIVLVFSPSALPNPKSIVQQWNY